MSVDEVIQIIKKRRSVRMFRRAEIPENIIKNIVDCGRLAPTARNLQPWRFVVITKRPVLESIAGLTDYGKFLKDASCCILVFCENTKYYLEDGCAATENILIGAQAYGIGSCWIAGDKKPYTDDVAKVVRAPEGLKLVSIIALGYASKETVCPQKKSLDEVLVWENW
ncbi:MAG: nitroreductase family protein [Candidatus Omnitrophica bacterium]|nr:nitroreductase family protein [Candidatus Omnitrophota bacterium]MCM8827793.1 nitroreductase family protein [Candidatus Omnitrophota bacterium]